jgi:hypothetical protein
MNKNYFLLLTTFCSLFFSSFLFSQVREVDFSNRVSQSQLIIEGEVISKRSFWDNKQHNIYTANEVMVYKIFKGTEITQVLEVITPGGTVGLNKEEVQPSLALSIGDKGIFTLLTNDVAIENSKAMLQYKPYASVQGFIKYDINTGSASGVFDKYKSIEEELYPKIKSLTNKQVIEVQSFSLAKQLVFNSKLATVITDFSPTTASAGTATTITINGSGFGATIGSVRFSNADDGGASFIEVLPSEIISWNDTQIVVEIAQDAGTGPIQVLGTSTVTSSQSLTVTYAQLNANFNNESYQTRHINKNANGGYIWQMFTDFDANTTANAAFVRSLESWRCSTGINWEIGTVTTTDVVANDDINIVRHDNGSELPNGVLGRCTNRFSGCISGGSISWFVEELDIVFNDDTNWNYTVNAPAFTEYDFESVSVHELGHGHQLGHVVDTNDVMHFSISNGEENRVLSSNNLAGANDVQSRSTASGVCGQSEMISAFEDASFSYDSGIYSLSDPNPSPTITGDLGGVFSSTPAGLMMDSATGLITTSNSTVQSYIITYTTSGVCPVSIDFPLEISAVLGVESVSLNEVLQVYPNPNSGEFSLLYNGVDSLESLKVYDITGKKIQIITLKSNDNINLINLNYLPKGMYFISIQTNKASVTKKIVIE